MHPLRQRFGVSERKKVCAVVGQHRSTQRLAIPAPPDDEEALRAFLRAFSTERPRWGWRRAAKALRREGRHVNERAPMNGPVPMRALIGVCRSRPGLTRLA